MASLQINLAEHPRFGPRGSEIDPSQNLVLLPLAKSHMRSIFQSEIYLYCTIKTCQPIVKVTLWMIASKSLFYRFLIFFFFKLVNS